MNQSQAILLYNRLSINCLGYMELASGRVLPKELSRESSMASMPRPCHEIEDFENVAGFFDELSSALTGGANKVQAETTRPRIEIHEIGQSSPIDVAAEPDKAPTSQGQLFPESCSHEQSKIMRASNLGLDDHRTMPEMRKGKLIGKSVRRPRPEVLTPYEVGYLIGVSKDTICRGVHRRLFSWVFIRGTRRRWIPIGEVYRAAEAKKRGQIRGRKTKKEATQ